MIRTHETPTPTAADILKERGEAAQRSCDLAKKDSQQARARWASIGELAVEVHDAHPTAPGLVDAWRNAFLANQVSATDLSDAIWLHESNLAASTVPWIISHPTAIRSAWTSFATDAAVQFVASGSADIGALAKQIGMDEVEAHQLVGQAVLVTAIGHIDHGDAGAARGILAALIAQSQAENDLSSGRLVGRLGDGGAERRSIPAKAASGARRAPPTSSTNSATHVNQGRSQKADAPAIDHTGQIFPSALAMCSHWGVIVWMLGPCLEDGWTLERFLTTPMVPSSDEEDEETERLYIAELAMSSDQVGSR